MRTKKELEEARRALRQELGALSRLRLFAGYDEALGMKGAALRAELRRIEELLAAGTRDRV